jgi:membrane protease YdiL (CAAX protease family)
MNELAKTKGSTGERLLVVLICFGYLIFASTYSVVAGMRKFDYTTGAAIEMLVLELSFGIAAAVLLSARGWKREDFGFRITTPSTLGAIVLFAVTYVACMALYALASGAGLLTGLPDIQVNFAASPVAMLLFLMVNSVFEELFVVGYLIEATPQDEIAFAVSVSALVRLLYHTYQGPVALTSILPIGILFALAYVKWRNLWPLILAHTVLNVMSWMMT